MNRKTSVLLIILLVFGLIGCAGLQLKSVCDDLAEPSYLCEIAKKFGVRLEDIGNGLIIVNAFAIGEGAYSLEDAIKLAKDLRSTLDDPLLTNALFGNKLSDKVKQYPGLFDVVDSYLSALKDSVEPMFKKDREILVNWLDKRIKSIER